jgi:hypothetical protein
VSLRKSGGHDMVLICQEAKLESALHLSCMYSTVGGWCLAVGIPNLQAAWPWAVNFYFNVTPWRAWVHHCPGPLCEISEKIKTYPLGNIFSEVHWLSRLDSWYCIFLSVLITTSFLLFYLWASKRKLEDMVNSLQTLTILPYLNILTFLQEMEHEYGSCMKCF